MHLWYWTTGLEETKALPCLCSWGLKLGLSQEKEWREYQRAILMNIYSLKG